MKHDTLKFFEIRKRVSAINRELSDLGYSYEEMKDFWKEIFKSFGDQLEL